MTIKGKKKEFFWRRSWLPGSFDGRNLWRRSFGI